MVENDSKYLYGVLYELRSFDFFGINLMHLLGCSVALSEWTEGKLDIKPR
jgi:hypothetical protein